jgi:SAM-dependent methyltransferase
MSTAAVRLQDEVNRAVYHSRGVYRHYLHTTLTAAETACLAKYQPHILGRDVLDIGVGAGRTARHLAPLARRYEAVDYSPVMVEYTKQILPGISVRQADFRDLSIFIEDSFDFIFATDNVIDALSHEDRLRALQEASRVLRPGGYLAFSCHNLRYKRALSAPWLDWSSNPLRLAKNLVRCGQGWWNYLRVSPLRHVSPEYALLNDRGHFYACLHYYAPRSTVSRQLADRGLRLIEAFDPGGRVAPEGKDDSDYPSLLYVAQTEQPGPKADR